MKTTHTLAVAAVAALVFTGPYARDVGAWETLCDSSYQNCRSRLLTLIQDETVGIDVGLWFMEDSRYATAIIQRWNAGVPVRILMDPRADSQHPSNADVMQQLASAGIPMRKRIASGVEHWKMMLFAGQGVMYFGSANFSAEAFVPTQPYVNYVDESIFYTDQSSLLGSFKTRFDDAWVDTTNYANFANAGSSTLHRSYPTYPIDPALNFVPNQNFATRSVTRYNAETDRIYVMMYRITDRRHVDAMLNANSRGVGIRVIGDPVEYRDATHLWDAWSIDTMYHAGIPIRMTAHQGTNHGKLVLLYSQGMTIFGSSNWTTSSAESEHEHNYFTTDSYIFEWFRAQFYRKWHNTDPAGTIETVAFTPLPPDKPKYVSPANGGAVSTATASLKWYGGPWAHKYDVYFGTTATPPLVASNLALGPSTTSTTYQRYTTPTLARGRTYYWKIVSKTMAPKTASGAVWSFTAP